MKSITFYLMLGVSASMAPNPPASAPTAPDRPHTQNDDPASQPLLEDKPKTQPYSPGVPDFSHPRPPSPEKPSPPPQQAPPH